MFDGVPKIPNTNSQTPKKPEPRPGLWPAGECFSEVLIVWDLAPGVCDFAARGGLHSPEGIGHAQAHGLPGGENAGEHAEPDGDDGPEQQIAGGEEEHR